MFSLLSTYILRLSLCLDVLLRLARKAAMSLRCNALCASTPGMSLVFASTHQPSPDTSSMVCARIGVAWNVSTLPRLHVGMSCCKCSSSQCATCYSQPLPTVRLGQFILVDADPYSASPIGTPRWYPARMHSRTGFQVRMVWHSENLYENVARRPTSPFFTLHPLECVRAYQRAGSMDDDLLLTTSVSPFAYLRIHSLTNEPFRTCMG